MPQKGRRAKVAKRVGKAVRRAGTVNKETVLINMTWDLSGHNYGPQLVLKRKEISEDMVVDAPREARAFDDETDVVRKQSRYCVLSRTKDGMQTGASFIQYLRLLDKMITARSEAEVAAGGTPIERPVVLLLDNHASRFDDEVLEEATGEAPKLGIRLWTEEAGVSGFLQALDQYNAQFHRAYNKALKVYKQAYKARYKTELPGVDLKVFLKVLGGDAELGLPGMWFTWADPFKETVNPLASGSGANTA